MELSQKSMTLKVGETKPVTVKVIPENATDRDEILAALEFTSSVEENVTVAKADGEDKANVTAVKAGKAKISAKSGEFTIELDVTANAAE